MPEAAGTTISGVERAAVFLLSLGEDVAANVMKHLGAKDVQKVGAAMAQMSGVTRQQLETVMSDFAKQAGEHTSLGVGSQDYIRKVLVNALGEDKAGNIIDRIMMGNEGKGLESLKWMDPRAVAELIRHEHPQIIAIVLAYLDADQSAEVLSKMPDKIRPDIIMRIANLESIQPSALQHLDEMLEKQSSSGSGVMKSSSMGGAKVAAGILNLIDSASEEAITSTVRENDEDLGQKIQDLMFVFDNLLDLEDRDLQVLLREVTSESLVVALKGTDEAIREKFFRNMSERAADMLRDDLEVRGPMKLSEVEAAQRDILNTARKLADVGTISLGGKGEEYV